VIFNVRPKSKGFALVLVLWVLSLLTLMAGSFAVGMRREVSITEGIKNNAQAIALAQSGIAVAELMLLGADENQANATPGKNWRTDGSIYQIMFDNAQVRIRMLSETGKIDINQADPGLLKALLMHAPAPEEARKDQNRVAKLLGAVLDWRDADENVRTPGAEKTQYQAAGLKYHPRNKGFQNIEELQMVLGMDSVTFTWLEPLITVYSGQAQVDKTATRQVLSILPDLEPAMLEQFLIARAESAKFDKPLTFPITSKYINAADTAGAVQTGAVSIIAEARLGDGSSASVSTLVVKAEIDPASPFQALKWQRNYANEVSLFSTTMSELLVAQCIVSQVDIKC
jgi:general secretion pathway protein K